MKSWQLILVGLLLISLSGTAWAQRTAGEAPESIDDGEPPRSSPQAQGSPSPIAPEDLDLSLSGDLKPILIWEHRDFGKLGPPPRENSPAHPARRP